MSSKRFGGHPPTRRGEIILPHEVKSPRELRAEILADLVNAWRALQLHLPDVKLSLSFRGVVAEQSAQVVTAAVAVGTNAIEELDRHDEQHAQELEEALAMFEELRNGLPEEHEHELPGVRLLRRVLAAWDRAVLPMVTVGRRPQAKPEEPAGE